MASQNTVHPEDDRVFSIRELMLLMNIPKDFKWVSEDEAYLNKMSMQDKKSFMKKNEINIRQSIGEAVPTIIMQKISFKIKKVLTENNPNDREIKQIIKEFELINSTKLQEFVKKNEKCLSLNALSRIAELANTALAETAAFYTDTYTLTNIFNNLPYISKDEIRILEPSVGVGNFIPFVIKKYEYCKKLIIEVCDINENSLNTFKILLEKMRVPSNVEIIFINDDFLLHDFDRKYDLIIGNPPFIKLSNKLLKTYKIITGDSVAKNSSAFFLEKAYTIADSVIMILPKYFLHNSDFSICRERTSKYAVTKVIDFGEKGFKGVLIETICVFVSTLEKQGTTECVSITHQFINVLKQMKLCDAKYPSWLLYRDEFFDKVSMNMKFDIFTCYRDRQITNKDLKPSSDIWVIKSRNILRNGSDIVHISGYDSYLSGKDITKFSVSKYYERDDVFLSPNMTYYPRVVIKPKNTLVNGSVAILELKDGERITDDELKYYASEEFQKFYAIARNLSTRSLNIDSTSIFYFGRKQA